jgi:hypothetical protein
LFTNVLWQKKKKKKKRLSLFFLAIRDVGAFMDNSFSGGKKYILHHPKEYHVPVESFFFILKQKLILEM